MAAENAPRSGLQVNEDRPWQEKFWTVQRVAWVLMALFIVAALAGLTGRGGPLASATARSGAGTIDYPRITRWQSDEQVEFRLAPSSSGEVELIVSPQFGEAFATDSIVPEPSQSRATGAGHHYTFDVGPGEKAIVFNVTSAKPAVAKSIDVKIGDAPPVQLTVTVLP